MKPHIDMISLNTKFEKNVFFIFAYDFYYLFRQFILICLFSLHNSYYVVLYLIYTFNLFDATLKT